MTARQALDRAVQRFAGIDIRLAGDWDTLPPEIKAAAPEIAQICHISQEAVTTSETIGQLAGRIGSRFSGQKALDFDLL